MSLSNYVKHRNGVPLGGSGSLSNMLRRSLGAGSIAGFWRFWNPIWGYYLGKMVFKPAKKWLPTPPAIVFTFIISGALHDLLASLLLRREVFICTPWFFIMGLAVVLFDERRFTYAGFKWPVRAAINSAYIGISLALAVAGKSLLSALH
ncbi:MAG: hypothetical protein KJP04_04870 [Arenicella sp.]|nr:hypothetical protein [Arenicella sp.]